jgi:lipopolysaccharide assembly outer membrane protein LptD (OstA)
MRLTASVIVASALALNIVVSASGCRTANVRQSGTVGQSAQTDLPNVIADTIQRTSASTVLYRGHVEIAAGTTVVTADEADLTVANGSAGFDLRGNVHLRATSGK